MAVQDQTAALARGRAVDAYHIHRIVVIADHRRKTGQIGNVAEVDSPAVHVQPARGQLAGHEILRRLLVAACRRVAAEL